MPGQDETKPEVEVMIKETRAIVPIVEGEKPTIDPSGKPAGVHARLPTRFDHPLAIGVKKAKELISSILADPMNLAMLRLRLEELFMEDPAKFLLVFEPLLRKYEDVTTGRGGTGKSAVKIVVSGPGPTQVNLNDGDENVHGRLS